MKVSPVNNFNDSNIITLKNQDWLNKQRVSGKVTADALTLLENLVKEKTTKSLLELDSIAKEFIIKNGCIPTFLNYKGFPNSVCSSTNLQLVHGIPTNYKLQDGDLISFDLGATYEGVISDSAITCIYGQPKSDQHTKLIKATEEALMKGIAAIKIGNRIGTIGQAIYKCAKGYGFGVVTNYGGHGIDITQDGVGVPHAPPFICNKSTPNEGIIIQPGLVIAIEPLLTINTSPKTHISSDGWTVVCDSICSHQEHSIFIHQDHVEIVTYRDNETYLKSNKLYFKD